MLIQGSVGQPSNTSIQPGTTPTLRQGQLGEMVVQSLHSDYYETTYRRNMFNAATQAGVTLSAGLATATTGLILTNPTTSSVNLVPNYVNFATNAVPAASMIIGLAFNTSTTAVTQTTAITPRNSFLGGAAPQGLVASSVTFPTAPIISHILGSIDFIATPANVYNKPTQWFDVQGSIVMPPGSYLCFYGSTASAASSFFASISWEEVPV